MRGESVKNKKYLLFFFTCLFLFPFGIHAKEGIDNYYIDAKIKTSGDLEVTEVFVLNGKYNGMERIVTFQNDMLKEFDGSASSFEGSSIYNGSAIEIEEVGEISLPSQYAFSLIHQTPTLFTKSYSAESGSHGIYNLIERSNESVLRIYNPSSYHSAFYLKYTIHNIAVLHNDYGELYWNLFSDKLTEYVNHLELYLHVEGNENTSLVWTHGPLHGESKIIDKETLFYTIDDLEKNTAVDIRTLFDKEVISESTKRTNVDAYDKVLKVEEERANDTNSKRNRAKVVYYGTFVINTAWLIGLLVLLYYMYQKYDKELKPEFQGQYFRDFPNTYGPEIVGYLFNRNIDSKEFSAAILNLMAEKIVTFEKINEKDYQLTYLPKERTVKQSDQILIDLLFGKIGKDNHVTLDEIQKYSKKHYEPFLKSYNKWKSEALKDALSEDFYENNGGKKTLAGMYSLVGILLAIFTLALTDMILYPIILIIVGFVTVIYFATMTKKTKKGSNEYAKWKGLRNFMNDFGNFSAKELPEIALWEKYLVYATIFGLAKKLAKQMEVKIAEMPESDYTLADYYFDRHYMNSMLLFSNRMNTSITNSVHTANATYATAHSSYSSGAGHGGGSSLGGGFGGGGGGGGRF